MASKVTTNTLNLSGDRVLTLSREKPFRILCEGWKDARSEENEHLVSETCAQTTDDNSFWGKEPTEGGLCGSFLKHLEMFDFRDLEQIKMFLSLKTYFSEWYTKSILLAKILT